MADFPAPPIFTELPRRKFGVAAFLAQNTLLLLPPGGAANPLPPGMQLSAGVAAVARKTKVPQVDVYRNNLGTLLFNPVIAPFVPILFQAPVNYRKTISADMSVVAYQVDVVATQSTKAPIFTELPTRKRQVFVHMSPNTLLVNPPPAAAGALPPGQQLQVPLVQRKRPVTDLNSLWPNSRTFGAPIITFVPFVNQDFSRIHKKYNVYDINYLWANSQIPAIPPPIPSPPSNLLGKTRPGGRMIFDAKKQGETIPLSFDFISRVGFGETIASVACTATLFSGTDPNPSAILAGVPSYSGLIATQEVQGGVVGCVYGILMKVTTNLGNLTEMSGFLAIEQDFA